MTIEKQPMPVLVTPPSDYVVTLDFMKGHLRVDHDEDDSLIEAFMIAAAAYLDGWKGVLGRAIQPQTWRQTFSGPGPYRLAMPDVISVVVTGDGDAVAGAVVSVDAMGPVVTMPDGVSPAEVVIEYFCGMPPHLRVAAQVAVMLLVGHWYQHRESVGDRGQEIPMGFDMLISPLRWRPF